MKSCQLYLFKERWLHLSSPALHPYPSSMRRVLSTTFTQGHVRGLSTLYSLTHYARTSPPKRGFDWVPTEPETRLPQPTRALLLTT